MYLQLADKPSFKQRLLQVGRIITAPIWMTPKLAWVTFWNNLPKAEKDRQAANLVEVKNNLNANAGRNLFGSMNFDNAEWVLNNLPAIIQDANNKFATTPTSKIGEKRVLSRYLKSFNQILDEVYAWGVANTPPDLNPQTALPEPPPPSNIQPVDPEKGKSFPQAPEIDKKWYQNPIVLIGGAGLLLLAFKTFRK